jgi:hypothetical protein
MVQISGVQEREISLYAVLSQKKHDKKADGKIRLKSYEN